MKARTTDPAVAGVRRPVMVATLVVLAIVGSRVSAEPSGPGLSATGLVDLRLIGSDSAHSWMRRGPDKLRFDETDSIVQLADVGVELRYTFDLQSDFRIQLHHYPDPEQSVELTEAYWRYRTLGNGTWRSQYRVGAFYPASSMENSGPLWSSPYTLSSSAINTWVGEEIRIVGAEGRWTWMGDAHGRSNHRLSFFASLFGYNDTMGAMMSWRGWSVHDRQTGLNGTLPLRELPAIVFLDHSREFEPFMEIDDNPGFYVGTEWNYARKLKVQFLYYDNLADDTIRQDDQYGWRTHFTQLGFHFRPGAGVEILGQYMVGNTIMAEDAVVNDFDAAYLMGVKTWGRHRLALRLELFRVVDVDGNFFDLNAEDGDSQTLSYSYLFRKHWKLSLEATRFFSRHDARIHFDEEVARTGHQLTASLRYYF